MKINFSPVKTCVNYGINDFCIEDANMDPKSHVFDGVNLENFNNCQILNEKPQIPNFVIADKLYEQTISPNYSLNLNILKSSSTPIVLNFDFDDNNDVLCENVTFNVNCGVSTKLIINYFASQKSFHNGFLKFCLQDNSKLDVVIVSHFDFGSTNILNIESSIKSKASFTIFSIDFGCKYSVLSQHTNLVGDTSRSDSKCLYLGGKQNQFDLNLVDDVYGQNCFANIESIGALLGEAKKNFKGTINFVKGCKKSSGNESELCMLLSKRAKSKALPMLLCTEEDVDGSHSSAVGKIDDKELFYVMTRGLSRQEALKLVVKAKFNSILSKIFDKELQNRIIKEIDGKLEDDENL